jgi:putative membrane protein
MLVDEHGADARMILSMVGKRGQVLPDMKPFDEADKADMQLALDAMAKLDELQGRDFDREFLRGQVAMHDKTLAKLDLEITQVKDNPDLVQALRNDRPVIVKHKEQAQLLLGLDAGNERQRK